MKRLAAVLFWSVIAAAFIGPGTVTTCASAGAAFGPALLWALTFSTLACVVLQEAAARLAVVSGASLGRALRSRRRGGVGATWMTATALTAILLGCAAYEAGNLLGAAAGLALAVDVPRPLAALALGLGAGALLWLGSTRAVVRVMSVLVAVMGVAFVVAAVGLGPDLAGLLRGALVPSIPNGAGLLVIGLVGTTVVPYNLFLGSGIAAGQRLGEMRFGLTVAIVLGGLISMAIVVVGGAVQGPFGFAELADVLAQRIGGGRWLLAAGLFAAGFSSAITAPLAAAITARDLLAGADDATWHERSWRWRAAWGSLLAVGVGFAATGVRPVPAIILAQAANGVLLPVVAVFLLLVVNDARLMSAAAVNGRVANLAAAGVCAVAVVLGTSSVVRAAAGALGAEPPSGGVVLWASAAVLAVTGPLVARALARRRRHG